MDGGGAGARQRIFSSMVSDTLFGRGGVAALLIGEGGLRVLGEGHFLPFFACTFSFDRFWGVLLSY